MYVQGWLHGCERSYFSVLKFLIIFEQGLHILICTGHQNYVVCPMYIYVYYNFHHVKEV